MHEALNEAVSVALFFDCKTMRAITSSLEWQGRPYRIRKVGFHHTYRSGRVLIHVFSVTGDAMFFRLELATDTLHWSLTEISDGQPE